MDFFTVEVPTFRGLVRYFVLFTIDLKTRRVHGAFDAHPLCEGPWSSVERSSSLDLSAPVHIPGIVHEACGQWMERQLVET
jgi:hypothetical protein